MTKPSFISAITTTRFTRKLLVGIIFLASPAFAVQPHIPQPKPPEFPEKIAKSEQPSDSPARSGPTENEIKLRALFTGNWKKFRKTNQHQYAYIRDSANFRAYYDVCEFHNNLNVDMAAINALAVNNMEYVITAHFEEEELALLESMTEQRKKQNYFDMAYDAYSYEYALATVAHADAVGEVSNMTKKYCNGIAGDYFQLYASLRRKAQHAAQDRNAQAAKP